MDDNIYDALKEKSEPITSKSTTNKGSASLNRTNEK